MGRTKEQQREYMREYRARKKGKRVGLVLESVEYSPGQSDSDRAEMDAAFDALLQDKEGFERAWRQMEEEVRHLKEELAKRPPVELGASHGRFTNSAGFNTRPFTPVPKTHR